MIGLLSPLLIYCFAFCVDQNVVRQRHSVCQSASRLVLSLSSSSSLPSFDPNESETPEERKTRTEQVKKIQAAFYQSGDTTSTCWSTVDELDPSLIHNLPLWRVQWVEFPGYQNVLNVHVPHYTHMFRQVLYQNDKKSWYFGHVYLPGGSENLNNPAYALPSNQADEPLPTVATIGTLMRITDYIEEQDGRLTLIVQAVGRLHIWAARKQVPYAVADTARLLIDWEASKVEDNLQSDDSTKRYNLKRAQAVTAVKEAHLLRDLEFLPVTFKDTDQEIPSVSPLSNVDGKATINWGQLSEQLDRAFREQIPDSNVSFQSTNLVEIEVEDLERDVWISLDRMLRLLQAAQPGLSIPVPTQLLGLLPTERDTWPERFKLDFYADQLEARDAMVGLSTKSPFVRLSRAFPEYPATRRASRLSYTIWLLISSIVIGDQTFDRQAYLETHSLRMRLRKTLAHINGINSALEQIVK